MQLNEQNILSALRAVQDPDLHKNIVELNFVQNLKIEGTKVSFDLRLTTPACPIRDRFKDQCIAIVKSLGATEVEVTLTSSQGRVGDDNSAAKAPQNSHIGEVAHVVAVASGKGGVGKSTVTANLAMALSLSGARVGILDADIYGPSMGLMFGIDKAPEVFEDNTIAPVEAKGGISIVSMCMFADSDKATIWRGPMVSQMIQHFIHHVRWGKLDYLLVDFPPGTGDIQLTLTQNCPMAGAVVVTTPVAVRRLPKSGAYRLSVKSRWNQPLPTAVTVVLRPCSATRTPNRRRSLWTLPKKWSARFLCLNPKAMESLKTSITILNNCRWRKYDPAKESIQDKRG